LKGNILWQKQVNQNPIACQRLPNGNTFIATYQSVMEVTREGKEVFSYSPGGGTFLFGAHKLRNGHIVCISAQNALIELDRKGTEVRRLAVPTNGNWCSVEGLPGGRFLVAMTGSNKVMEIDSKGTEVWSCVVQGACSATRLANSNVLVACMGNNRVVEVDRKGNKVREIATEGRPFRAHYR
jgi:outer membrane protein assembly factor BamB